MSKKANEFINKKKRKKALKRLSFASFIVIIGIFIFIYKAPIFNIKNISFSGIITLNEEELKSSLNAYKGKNIYTVNYKDIENVILKNPYINEVSIKKNGINELSIKIKENEIAFYIDGEDEDKIINNNMILVEKVHSVEGRSLIKLIGIEENNKGVGEKVSDNQYIEKILKDFYPIIEEMPSEHKFQYLDVSDITNVKGQIGEVRILFGDTENLIDKMNIVLNAIDQGVISKGYIDLSFDGPAVIKQEQ